MATNTNVGPLSTEPQKVLQLESQHEDSINDVQFDYYGTQIASCDSNGFLQISTIKANGAQEHIQTFQAHEGPAWQVAWAHPKFESVIATCGYDNKVKVWRKDQNQNWENIVFQQKLSNSVNCIAWAPWEYGLILAAGTADGNIYIFVRNQKDGQWSQQNFVAHTEGVNGISWGPSTEPAMLTKNSQSEEKKFSLPPKRMVSGGNDKLVMIWEFREGDFSNPTGQEIGRHDDWVRDVAWCSSIGLQYDMIASCSEDKFAKVWKHDLKSKDKPWSETKITFPEKVPLWKVSWSQVGNLLAVSGGDNKVHIMSEETTGEWKVIQSVNEDHVQVGSAN